MRFFVLRFVVLLASAISLLAQSRPIIGFVYQQGQNAEGGIISPGAIANVNGLNFTSLPRVTVGGLPAAVLSYSAGQIQIRIPPGAAGTNAVSADVLVTTNGGTSDPFTLKVTPY